MSRFFFISCLVVSFVVVIRLVFFFSFPLSLVDGKTIHFTATIFDDPHRVGKMQQVKVRYGNFWQTVQILVITSADTPLQYGDTVEIFGTARYSLLKNKQTVIASYFPEIKAEKSGILPIFAGMRQKINAFCEKTFSQPYAGLLSGMLLGVKSTLPEGITRSFRITGVSHVVAASGMNVTLVAGFLMSFLGRFFKRPLAVLLSMGGIGGYMLMSGLDPSILRAGVMGILVFGAQIFGRQYSVLYSLFLTTGLLLFWDPLLLGDVGFQLSVLATMGIIFLKPFIPLKGFLLDDIGTTLAAQLATLPVLLATFGSYGVLSLLVNALVLWTIPLITIMGGIGITLGFIFQPLGQLLLYGIFPFLWYFIAVVSYFAEFHAIWQVTSWPLALSTGYYLIVVSLILLRKKERVFS